MFFIKYSKDRENLSRVLETNEKRFREVELRSVDVIGVITNSDIKYDDSEAKVDMCQEIQMFGFAITFSLVPGAEAY